MKLYVVFAFFFISTVSGFAAPLKVGMELTYPPFEMINPKGKPTGISVDLAKALGAYLKREVLIENIPFIGLIPSLKNGKIDIIISSLTASEQRQKSIAFSTAYLQTGLSLLINKNSPVQNIQDANQKGRILVVRQGTTAQSYALEHLTKATLLILESEASCVLEVVQGKADAFIYDQFSVFTQWEKHPHTTRANLNPFFIEYWAIGLRKEDEKLLGQINTFLIQFRSEGGFDKLANEYLKSQKEAFRKLGIPFSF